MLGEIWIPRVGEAKLTHLLSHMTDNTHNCGPNAPPRSTTLRMKVDYIVYELFNTCCATALAPKHLYSVTEWSMHRSGQFG